MEPTPYHWPPTVTSVDIDNDNDGIIDAVEMQVIPVQGQLEFFHNGENTSDGSATYGTVSYSAAAQNNIIDILDLSGQTPGTSSGRAANTDSSVGEGLTVVASDWEYALSGADAVDLDAAIANNDYVEVYFKTAADIGTSFVTQMVHHLSLQAAGGSNLGNFKMAAAISSDNFTSSNVLYDPFQVTPTIPDGTGNPYQFFGQEPDSINAVALAADTEYQIRFYLFDSQNHNGNATFNDQSIKFNTEATIGVAPGDFDGDGLKDYLDIDSDNDGIADNIESQSTANYIAPSGVGGTAAFVDANSDGLDDRYDDTQSGVGQNATASYSHVGTGLTPVNSDGSDPTATGITIDTIPDYLDLDSDGDGDNDNAENGLGQTVITNGTLSTTTNDADGDGLFDQYEDAIDGNNNDGYVVSEGVTDVLNAGSDYLPDFGGDASIGTPTPLVNDLDYRDPMDSVAPVAIDDDFSIGEDALLNGDVMANNSNGVDSDPNVGDTLFVSQVNGATTNVGTQITMASGALLTVNADGTFTYDTNGVFDYLDDSETATESFTYHLTDQASLESNEATVTITLSGTNDAPLLDLNGPGDAGSDYTAIFEEDSIGSPLALLLDDDAIVDDPEDNISVLRLTPTAAPLDILDERLVVSDNLGIHVIPLIDVSSKTQNSLSLVYDHARFDVVYGQGDIVVTNPSGNMDSDELQSLLRLWAYENANQNGTEGDRVIQVEVEDHAGTTSAASTITIQRTNDAPVATVAVDADGTVALVGDEVVPSAVLAPGAQIPEIAVGDLLAQLSLDDKEGDALGIGIILADETYGVWQYLRPDIAGHQWTQFQLNDPDNLDSTPVPDGEALLMDENAILRFIPSAAVGDDVELQFRVWDGTSVAQASNPPSSTLDDSGGTPPTNTSSLSSAAFSALLAVDSDGDDILNSDDVDDDDDGLLDTVEGLITASNTVRDTDSDGISDHLDIDSDDDGITDNVEAQATDGYIAPSGTQNTILDDNMDGLDDRYDNRSSLNGGIGLSSSDSAATSSDALLSPVDTDGLGSPDYLDPDSDDDGIPDVIERGDGQGSVYAPADSDGDGLADVFEGGNAFDPFDVNDENVSTAANNTVGLLSEYNFSADSALADNLSNVDPMNIDLNFRDADTDNDGVPDVVDIDDDNDGILDTNEGVGSNILVNPNLDENNPADAVDTFSSWGSGGGFGLSYQFNQADVPGWSTNATDGIIEIWENGHAGGDPAPSLAHSGNYFAEIVANEIGTSLYQDFATNGGDVIEWSIWHKGRRGVDVANVLIGDATVPISSLDVEATMSTDYVDWVQYTGTYIVPAGQMQTRLAFEGVSAAGATPPAISVGNFIDSLSVNIVGGRDSDGDGIADHLDIDVDNDGITDNIEAQATANYIAPSGPGVTAAFIDENNDGLDDAYDSGVANLGDTVGHVGDGLTPVNTDATDPSSLGITTDSIADYLDSDSDGDGVSDNAENGLGQTAIANGTLSTSANDADKDGLFDQYENVIDTNNNDGYRVSEGVTDPLTAEANQNGYLPDDGDAVAGSIVPLISDLNYRDVVVDNEPPVAQDDLATPVTPGTTVNIDVLANNGNGVDSDSDGDALTIAGIIDPANSGVIVAINSTNPSVTLASGTTVTLKPDGTLDVVVAPGITPQEKFDYVISDPTGATASATVTLSIDTDGDNVADVDDIDDDNDGILDEVESETAFVDWAGLSINASGTALTFTTDSNGNPLPSAVIVNPPTSPNGSTAFSIFEHTSGALNFAHGSTAGAISETLLQFADPQGLNVTTDGVVSVMNQSDSLTFTAINPPSGFSWIINSSANADISIVGNSITIDGSSTAGSLGVAPWVEFDLSTTTPIDGVTVLHEAFVPGGNNSRFFFGQIPDTDHDSVLDHLDLDSDNDGITDNIEAQSTDGPEPPIALVLIHKIPIAT